MVYKYELKKTVEEVYDPSIIVLFECVQFAPRSGGKCSNNPTKQEGKLINQIM